jgi:hypothetical protein
VVEALFKARQRLIRARNPLAAAVNVQVALNEIALAGTQVMIMLNHKTPVNSMGVSRQIRDG